MGKFAVMNAYNAFKTAMEKIELEIHRAARIVNNDDKLKEYLFQECLFDESYDSVANIADLVNHTICGAKEL